MVPRNAGNQVEGPVAGAMAVKVVEILEAIHVQQHHGQRRAAALAFGPAALQLFVERARVGQAGEWIGAGLGDLGFQLAGLVLQFAGVVFQVVVMGLDQQGVADPRRQLGAVDRLAQEIGGAKLQGLELGFLVVGGRDDDHGQIGPTRGSAGGFGKGSPGR